MNKHQLSPEEMALATAAADRFMTEIFEIMAPNYPTIDTWDAGAVRSMTTSAALIAILSTQEGSAADGLFGMGNALGQIIGSLGRDEARLSMACVIQGLDRAYKATIGGMQPKGRA